MTKDVPQVNFVSKFPEIDGIEVIRLEGIRQRGGLLDHSPQKPHQIKFYQLVFYTGGRTEQLVDFVSYTARKNTLFYIAKGQINAFKLTRQTTGYALLFTEDYFKKQISNLPDNTTLRLLASHLFSPKIQIPDKANMLAYVRIMFDEFHSTSGTFNKKAIIDALFIIILSKLEELKIEQTAHISDSDKLSRFLLFQTLLKQEYKSNRNASFYATKMNITYKHLNEICKEIIHSTAKQYIDAFIILEAKRRLTNSNTRSTELAYQLGFEEPTNFVKYFKKSTGLTPNQFKKTL